MKRTIILKKGIVACFALSLCSGAAMAADMDAESLGLRGAYAGVSFGYGFLRDYDPNIDLHAEGDDYVVGAHVGYMKTMGNYAIGFEIEGSANNITFDIDKAIIPFDITVERQISGKLRAGMHVDKALLYAVAGLTYANTNIGLDDKGIILGAGFEYAFTSHLTAGLEYNHSRFDDFDDSGIDATLDVVKARISYNF